MRRLRWAFIIILGCLGGRTALAQQAPAQEAGGDATEPAAPAEETWHPTIDTKEDGRYWIRGTPVEHPVQNQASDALRAFEREAFGAPPAAGGSDEDMGVPADQPGRAGAPPPRGK